MPSESRVVVTRCWGVWEMGEIGQRSQTSSCKINKFGDLIIHCDYS